MCSSDLFDAARRALMQKVRIVPRADFGSFESEIVVRKTDGSEIAGRMLEARGSIRNPLSEAELLAKFVDCASVALPTAQARAAGAALLALDTAPTLAPVVALLAPQD